MMHRQNQLLQQLQDCSATTGPRRLSTEQVHAYKRSGFVCVRALISPQQVVELREDYDQAMDGQFGDLRWTGKRVQGRMVQLGNALQVLTHWADHDFMRHARSIAQQLEGADQEYSYDQLIMKPPHYPKDTECHQDAGYWQNDRACTCWLALSNSTRASGAMQFVPGSHLGGILPHIDASARSEINNALEADLTAFDASVAKVVELQPGDCTFHHCRTLHYAGGNSTNEPRRALITHFQPRRQRL